MEFLTLNSDGYLETALFEFGGGYELFESLPQSTTSSTTFQSKLSVTTALKDPGDYLILWSAAIGTTENNKRQELQVLVDGVQEALQTSGFRFANTEAYSTGLIAVNLASSDTIDIDVEFRRINGTATIKDVRVAIWKVA